MSAFLFPIYVLSAPGPELDRLEALTSWCAVERGKEFLSKQDEDKAATIYEDMELHQRPSGAPASFDEATEEARVAVVGMKLLGMNGGAVPEIIRDYNEVKTHIAHMTSAYGKPSSVMIHTKLVWERIRALRDSVATDLPERCFKVLGAVNCILGDKEEPVIARRDQIRALSVGLKSSKGFFGEGGNPLPKQLAELRRVSKNASLAVPTTQQLRNDLKHLEVRQLIQSMHVSRRDTAYFRPAKTTEDVAIAWLTKRLAAKQRRDVFQKKVLAIRKDFK